MKALVDKQTKQAYVVGDESFVEALGKNFKTMDVIEVGNIGQSRLHSKDNDFISTLSISKKGSDNLSDDYHITFRNPLEIPNADLVKKFYTKL